LILKQRAFSPRTGEAAMILVVGGTGDLGGRVAGRLLDAGHRVRCLVRPGTDGSALRAAGAELVQGDLTDPASLRAACAGVDIVVASATVISRRLAGAKVPTIREVEEQGMTALVDAAEAGKVQRFVYVSYAGVGDGPRTPMARAKLAVERRLARSPMRRVIVRPDAFQEVHLAPVGRFDLKAGKVATFGKGDTKHRWVATDDVAALVAGVATERNPPELIVFGGPEAISRNECVAVAERSTGRSIKVMRAPLPVARLATRVLQLSGRGDAMASIIGLGVLMDECEITWDDAPLRERGITPRSATDWITQQAAALHAAQ
jgi:uncharacterized protein YbjT (DUF2867 family)